MKQIKSHNIFLMFSVVLVVSTFLGIARTQNIFQDIISAIKIESKSYEVDPRKPLTDHEVLHQLHQKQQLTDCVQNEDDKVSNPCTIKLHAITKTNAPIIGILTQPFQPNVDKNYRSFIEVSQVKFIESGGARVIPVDYRLSKSQLNTLLPQIDGVYIPGDSAYILSQKTYLKTVFNILQWAQSYNAKGKAFPVLAVSYGLAASLKCQTSSTILQAIPPSLQHSSAQLNLLMSPSDTYLYDQYTAEQADELFASITLYNQMNQGIQKYRFAQVKEIGKVFVPVATYEQEDVSQDNEYVAIVEGIAFPFFGLAFSPEKVLFNYDYNLESKIDFSALSITHSQMISNFLSDEAKLSANQYSKAKTEKSSLIHNYDPVITKYVVEDGTTSTNFVYRFS